MPNLELTPRERSALRAAAHPLRPVVLIGDRGLTEAVLQEIDRHLNAHSLIKVRAGGEDRESREEIQASICERLSCALVHHLGKTLILYRPGADGSAFPGDPAPEKRSKTPDVYIPKKQAAAGRTALKPGNRAKPEAVADKKPVRHDFDNERPARPTLHRKKASARRPGAGLSGSIKRGSALSLRAGARRGRG